MTEDHHVNFADARTGMEAISEVECWRLLAQHQRDIGVGRVAVVDHGRPVVVPVNFVLLQQAVAFRTAPGTKLDAAVAGCVAAFEIDHVDRSARTGWSVLAQGHAEAVSGTRELLALRHSGLQTFGPHDKEHWVMIHIDRISGRRVPFDGGHAW